MISIDLTYKKFKLNLLVIKFIKQQKIGSLNLNFLFFINVYSIYYTLQLYFSITHQHLLLF